MTQYRIGTTNRGVSHGTGGVSGLSFPPDGPPAPPPPPPPPPPPDGLTVVVLAGFVDTAGNEQLIEVVDGETVITGTAPFFVDFFLGNSRSVAEDANDDVGAAWNMNYRVNFGEDRGGTWPRSGLPIDTQQGAPMFGHGFETVGAHPVVFDVIDSEARMRSVSLTVNATDPGAGVDMTSGVFPTFVEGTVYNAPADGVWGALTGLEGQPNVIIRRKPGTEGADPYFASVNLDSRNEPTELVTRTAGFRMLNCDVGAVTCGNVGFAYAAFINGRVGGFTTAPMRFGFSSIFENSRTETQANNIRYPRGLLLQNTGELNPSSDPDYCLVECGGRNFHFKDTLFQKATSGQHTVRGTWAFSSFYGADFNNLDAAASWVKTQGEDCTNVDESPDRWQQADLDRVGDFATERLYGRPSEYLFFSKCRFGLASGVTPTSSIGMGPENNDPGLPPQGCLLGGFEDCIAYPVAAGGGGLTGYGLAAKNILQNNGAGDPLVLGTGSGDLRVPPGLDGPYILSGTRPAFPD